MKNNEVLLNGILKAFKESNEFELNDSEVFEIFSLTQIHKDKNITYENTVSSIVDGGNDGGIDSLMVFVGDEYIDNIEDLENFLFDSKTEAKFIISQCKTENSFKESTIDKLITTIPVLLDLENDEKFLLKRFNSDLVLQAILLKEVWKKTSISGGNIIIDFEYISKSNDILNVNGVINQKIDQLKELTKRIFNCECVSFEFYGCVQLLDLYKKQKSSRLQIEFKDRPLSTDYDQDGIGYIGTVKLANYKKFLKSENGEIRDDLFESNIRHYQGLVDVNKKIVTTIENPSKEDFWWLNNGITIIAEEPKEVGKILSIENVQIVNGLQTSYSIFNSHNESDDDNRSVLVKVIINKNKETTDHIIASTNSQNPVSATLLRATEPIQRDLELYFLNEGYYYDRRKNYYKNQGKPATKIFSIQLTAQAIQSIAYDDPHTARSRPTSLLKHQNSYNKIFNPKIDFKIYLNCCLIYKKGHNFWLKYSDSKVKNKTSNFKLHLGSLLPKILLKKKTISLNELSQINIDEIDLSIFNESIKMLNDSIDEYLEFNTNSNLINIAKSKEFSQYIYNKIDVEN